MRGKLIPVRAKKRIDGLFEIGDKLHVQSVLHDEPKLLHRALVGAFTAEGKLLGIRGTDLDTYNKPVGEKVMRDRIHKNGQYLAKICEDQYAGVGTYSHSLIILPDGTEYNDSVLGNRTLSYAFDKI